MSNDDDDKTCLEKDLILSLDTCSNGEGDIGADGVEKPIGCFERGDSNENSKSMSTPNAFSDCSELDICVTDIASFLSGKDDESEVKRTKWSTRREYVKSPDFDNDFNTLGEYCCDYEDVPNSREGFTTPTNSVLETEYERWTPDIYESVTSSLKEWRKTYRESESSADEESSRPTSPIVRADEYVVRLPNMDIEDKAMYIDKLIVKSFRHLNNLTKVRFREMLDDDVITAVMERYKDQYADILFVTPCITKCVMVLQDQVANFLDPIKAKDYDLIFFVISDATAESSGTHWSLLLLNRLKKKFYHYDSMHGSHYNAAFELMYKVWSYFKIKKGYQPECEQQPNGTDCGFYVIHNMLRCIKIIKERPHDDDGRPIRLKEPLKLPMSIDQTKSIVIKTYIASIVEKIKKTATIEKF